MREKTTYNSFLIKKKIQILYLRWSDFKDNLPRNSNKQYAGWAILFSRGTEFYPRFDKKKS